MTEKTEVLIVGAGPTGLMMACQLLRFGIKFQIIDQRAARIDESRAIGIQAKSMEIFQNLGLVDKFLQHARVAKQVNFYINGKLRRILDFRQLKIEHTPYSGIYFLPQSETEQYFIDYLAQHHIEVARCIELKSFSQSNSEVRALLKNTDTGQEYTLHCDYIIGCDGAHSTVRHQLNLEFVGASYDQEFMLADSVIEWQIPNDDAFKIFFSRKGIFGYIPLWSDAGRIIAGKINDVEQHDKPLTVMELENAGKEITKLPLKFVEVRWLSRFHLHHRAVKEYSQGRAFLAGDAAHIHTPLGGQGMNTGLQDVTNLAWKLAFVLKGFSPLELLATYQTERQKIGEVLVKTTDRMFGYLTTRGIKGYIIRIFVLPLVVNYFSKFPKFQKRIFSFVSQLRIKYYPNHFIQEYSQNADTTFLSAPKAGERAPDAPVGNSTLFELLQGTICSLLVFTAKRDSTVSNHLQQLLSKYPNVTTVREFVKEENARVLFESYGVTAEGMYFIRPDGYIGFRCYGIELEALNGYLGALFLSG